MIQEFHEGLKKGNQYLLETKDETFWDHLSQKLSEFIFSSKFFELLGVKGDVASQYHEARKQFFLKLSRQSYSKTNLSPLILNPIPLGHVVVAVEGPQSLEAAFEAVIQLIYQGNHLFLVFPNNQLMDKWQKIFGEFWGSALTMMVWDEAKWTFLIRHPSIQGIFIHSPLPLEESLYQTQATTKPVSRFDWYKSFALVLKGNDQERSWNCIQQLIICGSGQCPWNVSRIFVEQSIEKIWLDFLREQAQVTLSVPTLDFEEFSPNFLVTAPDFLKTQGEYLLKQSKIEILRNVSSCDPLHQKPFFSPLVTFHDLRYGFEINKWVAGNSGLWGVFVFGPPKDQWPTFLRVTRAFWIEYNLKDLFALWSRMPLWFPIPVKALFHRQGYGVGGES